MAKKAIVLLAEGFEEVEAITPIDYLRRVGVELCTAAIGKDLAVKGSHDIVVIADALLGDLKNKGELAPSKWDAVIVPGGLPGSDNLGACKETGIFLKGMAEAGKLVCAICAAPARVLSPLGLLAGKQFTCYPGQEERVLAPDSASAGALWKQDPVVVDGNIITSRGAGTAGEFSCVIIGKLINEGEAKSLAEKVLMACSFTACC